MQPREEEERGPSTQGRVLQPEPRPISAAAEPQSLAYTTKAPPLGSRSLPLRPVLQPGPRPRPHAPPQSPPPWPLQGYAPLCARRAQVVHAGACASALDGGDAGSGAFGVAAGTHSPFRAITLPLCAFPAGQCCIPQGIFLDFPLLGPGRGVLGEQPEVQRARWLCWVAVCAPRVQPRGPWGGGRGAGGCRRSLRARRTAPRVAASERRR